MDILFHHPFFDDNDWVPLLQEQLPKANIHIYQKGDNSPADYALVWRPTYEMLSHRHNLKATFLLGAGVDAVLDQLQDCPELLPKGIPLYRLQDAGMVLQMQEYTIATVLRYFRRLDEYQQLQQEQKWQYLPAHQYEDFTIGVMGLGILGSQVAMQLARLGFHVKGWSYSAKQLDGVECYAYDQFEQFISGVKLIINLLPSTPKTQGILNKKLFNKLEQQAYLINIARGKHLIEEDLLNALDRGQIKAATLDVFLKEPLPSDHPFWQKEEITITPHISALTRADIAIPQIVEKINNIEEGIRVRSGLVDLNKGY